MMDVPSQGGREGGKGTGQGGGGGGEEERGRERKKTGLPFFYLFGLFGHSVDWMMPALIGEGHLLSSVY